MNTTAITENMMNLPVLELNGVRLNGGSIYRVTYREYGTRYHESGDSHRVRTIYIIPEYFCFKQDRNNVRGFIYSPSSTNPFFISAVPAVIGNPDYHYAENILGMDIENRDVQDVLHVDISDSGMTESERDLLKTLQGKIIARKGIQVKTGSYPFVHFHIRKMYFTDSKAKAKTVSAKWERCISRLHYGLLSIMNWFKYSMLENVYSFGIYITENKSTKDERPLMLSYISEDNPFQVVCDDMDGIRNEMAKLAEGGFSEIDTEVNISFGHGMKLNFRTFI